MDETTKVEVKEFKLEPEFKAKWLAALRSGDYKQARNSLFNKLVVSNEAGEKLKVPTYCCLGVACKVLGIAETSRQYEAYMDLKPQIPSELQDRCITWNDTERFDFAQIADNIEKEY